MLALLVACLVVAFDGWSQGVSRADLQVPVEAVEAREPEGELAQSHQALLEEQNRTQQERFNRQITTGLFVGALVIMGILFYFLGVGRKRSAEIEAQKQELERALREKEVLLKEIHHRVKNNMQVVSGLLELQAHESGDEEVSRVVNEGKSRIETMALIHQMLYATSNLSTICFASYVETLVGQITNAYTHGSQVHVELSIAKVAVDLDTCMTLGLITHELLNNTLKYAFPSGQGQVHIALNVLPDGSYVYTVADDGVGLPAGMEPDKADSLGLRLVRMLASDVRASVHFENNPGASCTLRWSPLAPLSS